MEDLKPLYEEGAKLIVDAAANVVRDWGRKLVQLDLIERAALRYSTLYHERHGAVKAPGMSKPVAIRDIYTDVQFASPDFLRAFSSPENLEACARLTGEANRHLLHRIPGKRSGIQVANETQYLSVLGQPGAGKSTFLRRMGMEALAPKKARNYVHDSIPVFVELKNLRPSEPGSTNKRIAVEDAIVQEFMTCGFPHAERFTRDALVQGKLLVLMDGIDEVSKELVDASVGAIRDFVDLYSSNRFIVSCRTAFYKGYFSRFTDVVVASFDDDQVRAFIFNWFKSQADGDLETAARFWNSLQLPPNRAAFELGRTPLLLTFLCLVYDKTQGLPANRSVLYKSALEILLREWNALKRIARDEIYRGLYPELEVLMLSKIAGPAFANDKIFFREEELTGEIGRFLQEELNAPKRLDGHALLKEIEVQQGLIVQRAHDVYSFSHLTIQEYLAAYYFREQTAFGAMLGRLCFDRRWREVLLLIAGMGNADDLLLRMVDAAAQYPKDHARLGRLLNWAGNVALGNVDTQSAAANRGLALFVYASLYAVVALARARFTGAGRDQQASRVLGRILGLARDLCSVLDNARWSAVSLAFESALTQVVDTTLASDLKLEVNMGTRGEPILDLDAVIQLDKAGGLAFLTNYLIDVESLRIFNQAPLPPATTSQSPPGSGDTSSLGRLEGAVSNFFSGLQLESDMFTCSDAELACLEKYLTSAALVVGAKEAALSVSSQAWDRVVERLFRCS